MDPKAPRQLCLGNRRGWLPAGFSSALSMGPTLVAELRTNAGLRGHREKALVYLPCENC